MAQRGFIDLGRRGMDYVREHLTGVNPFCTALGAAVDAAPGRVLVLPPPGVDLERLYRFSEGGLPAPDFGEVDDPKIEQAAYLMSLLRAAPGSVCIADDFEPSWSEAIATGVAQHAFGSDDAVYHRFTAEDAADELAAALRSADTLWHGVAAVCASELEIGEDETVTVDALQEAGAAAIAITCTAYEGEGFVVWRRL